MIISSVRSFLLSYPFPEPIRLPFYGGERTILKRDAMLIRIESDGGLVGYAPGPGSQRAHDIIESIVRPFLEGRTLADPDALRIQFMEWPVWMPPRPEPIVPWKWACSICAPRPKACRSPKNSAAACAARSGCTAAPGCICRPNGTRPKLRPSRASVFAATRCVRPAVRRQDLETVRQMRRAVGPDFDLMVDAHTWWRMGDRSYSFETVEQLAHEMAGYGIAWLEEPLPPDDHEAYLRLKEAGSDYLPLASGEHEPSEEAFRRPDPAAGGRLRADGRLLPGRLRHGPAPARANRARRAEIRVP